MGFFIFLTESILVAVRISKKLADNPSRELHTARPLLVAFGAACVIVWTLVVLFIQLVLR